MKPIKLIKEEHKQVERELVELETIMEEDSINYSNLIHVLKKLTRLWNEHEEKEEEVVFPLLKKNKGFGVPVNKMSFEHDALRPSREAIVEAINEGNESKVKEKMRKDGKEIIKKLRDHIDKEDELLYTIVSDDDFSKEDIKSANNALEKYK